MIDWTDRSYDVLARYAAYLDSFPWTGFDELNKNGPHERQLMQDLATMVHGLADDISDIAASQDKAHTREQAIASVMMWMRDPETGERLFPDPRA